MRQRLFVILSFLLALSLGGRASEITADTIRLHEIPLARIATRIGIRTALNTAITSSLKHYVDKTRPDGSDRRSFPSRHSIWAFSIGGTVAYTMVPHSPWWGVASQAAASAVGFQRVMGKHHYPEDVLAGAAIGIADNAIANIVASLIFGSQDFYADWHQTHNDAPRSLSISTGMELPFRHDFGNLHVGAALVSDIRFSQPVSRHWALTASVSLRSATIRDRSNPLPVLGILNALAVQVGTDVSTSFGSSPFALSGGVSAGYLHRFSIREQPIRHMSYVACASLDFSMMLTRLFALGLRSSLSLAASPIERHAPVSSASFSFYSRTTF